MVSSWNHCPYWKASLTWSWHFSALVIPEARYRWKISIFIFQRIWVAIFICSPEETQPLLFSSWRSYLLRKNPSITSLIDKRAALGNLASSDGGKLPSFRRAKWDGSWGCGQVNKILSFVWYGFSIKCWTMNKRNANKERNGRRQIIPWAALKAAWAASEGRVFSLSTPLSWGPT